VRIRNVIHKGLRRLITDDDPSGLQPAVVAKVRRIVSFLQDMEHEDELRSIPNWKAHQLTGDRKGIWSLFVTKNWRMTFWIDHDQVEIVDLDYLDYH
jgi:proteic killer suppression protein